MQGVQCNGYGQLYSPICIWAAQHEQGDGTYVKMDVPSVCKGQNMLQLGKVSFIAARNILQTGEFCTLSTHPRPIMPWGSVLGPNLHF